MKSNHQLHHSKKKKITKISSDFKRVFYRGLFWLTNDRMSRSLCCRLPLSETSGRKGLYLEILRIFVPIKVWGQQHDEKNSQINENLRILTVNLGPIYTEEPLSRKPERKFKKTNELNRNIKLSTKTSFTSVFENIMTFNLLFVMTREVEGVFVRCDALTVGWNVTSFRSVYLPCTTILVSIKNTWTSSNL